MQQQSSALNAFDSVRAQLLSLQTILLVEDEEIVREATFEGLQAAGYRVLKAKTPAEAVDLFCKEDNLSLLLTDVVLPGQDGRRLASYLSELRPGFKTIFISGYPECTLTRNLDAAENSYIAKPFSLEILLQKVRQVLGVTSELKVRRASCFG